MITNRCCAILTLLCSTQAAVDFGRTQGLSLSTERGTVISRSAGLQEVDGELWGCGDHYKVRFLDDGIEFTPALGERAPRNLPVRLRLVSIGRDRHIPHLEVAAPRAQDLRVEYDRGVAVERYDVGVDHLEQSFVFAERPAGRGDLVVRLALDSELAVSPAGDGLSLALPEIGGCAIGAVTGIDADGARVRGRVAYVDGLLELSLPADFVDRAALPFVLDPPIAGASAVSGTGGSDDRNPSVAYDATQDVYFVVWERIFSATDHDILGRRLDRTGLPIGSILFLETSSALATDAQVADCDARDAFIVVYTSNGDILGRAVSALNGAQGTLAVIAGGALNQRFGCVAGDALNPQVLCAWLRDPGVRTDPRLIQAASVTVSAGLTLIPGVARTVVSANTLSRPRISRSDRGQGRHAVVFERDVGNVAAPFLRIVDRDGVVISNELALGAPGSATLPQTLPDVDGDGTNWVAAWQARTPTPRSTSHFASISFDPATGQIAQNGFASMGTALGEDFLQPRVTWIVDSCLVGMKVAPSTGTVSAALVRSLDPFHCFGCEGEFLIGVTSRLEGSPGGAAVPASGGTSENVVLTWEQALAGNGDIIARGWRTLDGLVTPLDGGCGRGGSNRATCARSPNLTFALRLRDALPSAPTVFLFAGAAAGLSCGPCNIVPDLTSAIALPLATDASGESNLPFFVPALSPLIGVPLFSQWATIDSVAPACSLGLHFSDALRIVIEG
ncbi:MAG: hypothetical protein AB7I19_00425 [Planctomycetota bacterium]